MSEVLFLDEPKKTGGLRKGKALLIIDMLNDFADPKGKLYCKTAETVIPKIKQIRDAARKHNIPIIYVNDSHTEGDRELGLWGKHAMRNDRWGSTIVSQLLPRYPSEIIVYKRFYGGFTQTELNSVLKVLKVDTLFVTGMHTPICVQHICYDAFTRGYKIIVVSDATGTFTEEEEEFRNKMFKAMEEQNLTAEAKIWMSNLLAQRILWDMLAKIGVVGIEKKHLEALEYIKEMYGAALASTESVIKDFEGEGK